MADKSITDLNVVPGSIDDSNTWFAVAQYGAAYKVSGHDFILALTVILDGHGGIKSITGPTTVGLVDTYTITFADDTTTTFAVENGKGITGISKTGTSGLVDTYTITYNDGSTSTFTVTNGAKGDTGDSWYVWIRYSGSQPTQDSDMGTEPDNWMGIYSGTSSTAPVHYTDYDWFQIKGEKGDKGDPSTIVSQSVTYQEGTSPNVQPSGTWTTTIPVVSQGNYLWTRTIVTFNSGNPVTFFSVARMGLDGTGSVSSVNNQSPDANGNVTVTASDIRTSDSTSVQAEINGVKNTLTQLDGRVDSTQSTEAYVLGASTAGVSISGTGVYVIYNNALYTTTQSIASTDTAPYTGKIKPVFGGGLNAIMNATNQKLCGESVASHFHMESGNTVYYAVKIGAMIIACLGSSKVTTANTPYQIGTVDTGYRPFPGSIVGGAVIEATDSDFGYGSIRVNYGGNISVCYSKATTYGLYCTLAYIVE